MNFWRRSAGISRKDKIRNTRIREIMQINENILEVIENKRLSCYGNLKWMSENRIPWIYCISVCVCVCVPMPTHCTITHLGFLTRSIDGVECGLFSIHAPLGQTTLHGGRVSV